MEISGRYIVARTQSLVVGGISPVPWLSHDMKVPVCLRAQVGAWSMVVVGVALGWWLMGGTILCHTSDLWSLNLVTSSFHVLEPDCVVISDHRPPKCLQILRHLLEMHSHFITACIILEGHDGEVPIDESHG